MADIPCLAFIAAYNEADIIESCLDHYAEHGVSVYLVDNHSTDDTLVRALAHPGIVGWERFPATRTDEWSENAVAARVAELVAEVDAKWYVVADADDFLEPLAEGRTLAETLDDAARVGSNVVGFRCLEFVPSVGASFPSGGNPKELIPCWRPPHHWGYSGVLNRAFRPRGEPVELLVGGHDVAFRGRRVHPVRQLLRHYPFRDLAHAQRKILRERKPRFARERADRPGWHIHYDGIEDEGDVEALLRQDSEALRPLDVAARFELLEEETARVTGQSLRYELDVEALHRELETVRDELAARSQAVRAMRSTRRWRFGAWLAGETR